MELNFEDLKLENITDPNYQSTTVENEKESDNKHTTKDTADDSESESKSKSNAQKLNEKIDKEIEKEEKKEQKEQRKEALKEEKVDKKSKEVEEEVEEIIEHDLDLSPIYNKLIDDLGLDIKLEDLEIDPHKEEDLPEFLKAIVAENSKPSYASEEVEKFDKFVRDGGDPRKFLDTMYNQTDYEKINIDKATDSVKRKVVYDLYQNKYPGKDSEWIEKKIDRIENSGTLDDEAKDALEELVDLDKENKKNIFKNQEAAKEHQQKQYDDYVASVKTSIKESKEFGGIPVSEKDKDEFFKYMMVADKKTGKTGYMKDLEKQEDQLKLAYFQFKKFAFDDIKKSVKTEVTKDLKKNLSKYSTKPSGGSHVRSEGQSKEEGVDYSELRKLFEAE